MAAPVRSPDMTATGLANQPFCTTSSWPRGVRGAHSSASYSEWSHFWPCCAVFARPDGSSQNAVRADPSP
eukprot:4556750-Prymnesium_polylepis.2